MSLSINEFDAAAVGLAFELPHLVLNQQALQSASVFVRSLHFRSPQSRPLVTFLDRAAVALADGSSDE